LAVKYGDIYAWISIVLLRESAVTPAGTECGGAEL